MYISVYIPLVQSCLNPRTFTSNPNPAGFATTLVSTSRRSGEASRPQQASGNSTASSESSSCGMNGTNPKT